MARMAGNTVRCRCPATRLRLGFELQRFGEKRPLSVRISPAVIIRATFLFNLSVPRSKAHAALLSGSTLPLTNIG